MSLPKIAELEFQTEEIPSDTTSQSVHATLDWDFQKGDFKLVSGKTKTLTDKEYLKVWIQKALYTNKDTLIYKNTGYGSEHHSLIGATFKPSFIREEIKRCIKEALLLNDAITNVSNFSFSQEGSKMLISFDVTSIYGTTGEEVMV